MITADRPGSEVTLRVLTPADAAAFHALRMEALEAHPEAFATSPAEQAAQSLTQVAQSLAASPQLMVWGAWHGELLVATLGLQRSTFIKLEHKAKIWGVYVQPAYRGQGVGDLLLTAALEQARAMHGLRQVQLGVASTNHAAIALYERHGFVRFGTEPHSLCIDGKFCDEVWMQQVL